MNILDALRDAIKAETYDMVYKPAAPRATGACLRRDEGDDAVRRSGSRETRRQPNVPSPDAAADPAGQEGRKYA